MYSLNTFEMQNKLKFKESNVFVDIWPVDERQWAWRERFNINIVKNGTREGIAILASDTCPGVLSLSLLLS